MIATNENGGGNIQMSDSAAIEGVRKVYRQHIEALTNNGEIGKSDVPTVLRMLCAAAFRRD